MCRRGRLGHPMDGQLAHGWPAVAALATRQHGRVALAQVRALGIGPGAVDKAVASGRLHRVHRGVYAVGHLAPSAEGRWMAAVLACGPGALLSHRSAACLWGVRDGEGPRVDVTVPGRGGRRRPGIAVHRSALRADDDAAERAGIPVASVARVLVDLSFDLELDDLVRTVREAQYRRLFDLAAVQGALARRPSRALARVLEDLTPSTSPLEDAFLRLVDRYGLPRPVGQAAVLGYRVDFFWPHARLVVQLDGHRAHSTLDAFQGDRAQTNVLQLAGYLVLRFTATDVRRRPRRTARTVLRA